MTARYLIGLLATLGVGIAAAALLGVVNVIAWQGVYAVSAAALAGVFYLLPMLCRSALARAAPAAGETLLSLGAGGVTAVTVLLGTGAFAAVSAAVNADFVTGVWKLFFPMLPLFGALAGLGRFAYLEILRWIDADADDERAEQELRRARRAAARRARSRVEDEGRAEGGAEGGAEGRAEGDDGDRRG